MRASACARGLCPAWQNLDQEQFPEASFHILIVLLGLVVEVKVRDWWHGFKTDVAYSCAQSFRVAKDQETVREGNSNPLKLPSWCSFVSQGSDNLSWMVYVWRATASLFHWSCTKKRPQLAHTRLSGSCVGKTFGTKAVTCFIS